MRRPSGPALALAAVLASAMVGWIDPAPRAPFRGEADGAFVRQRPPGGTPGDWEIARERFRWAATQPRDGFAHFGEFVARLAERFVGAPYRPHTLESPGAEELVVNLEAFDCVTLVENVLALARLAWSADAALADDLGAFQDAFRDELRRIRYRGGVLDGYASRLHYFSEWIADNAAMGIVAERGRALGGVVDDSPIDFMSRHPDAYRQLADPAVLDRVARVERSLDAVERRYVPEELVRARAADIRDGDVIAATSVVQGLDVAHTGFALWRDGTLRLLHAPLVGSSVQVSPESLDERIVRIEGQDGVMVARPLAPGPRGPVSR